MHPEAPGARAGARGSGQGLSTRRVGPFDFIQDHGLALVSNDLDFSPDGAFVYVPVEAFISIQKTAVGLAILRFDPLAVEPKDRIVFVASQLDFEVARGSRSQTVISSSGDHLYLLNDTAHSLKDTLTGLSRLYDNPLGREASAITDIQAFASCMAP